MLLLTAPSNARAPTSLGCAIPLAPRPLVWPAKFSGSSTPAHLRRSVELPRCITCMLAAHLVVSSFAVGSSGAPGSFASFLRPNVTKAGFASTESPMTGEAKPRDRRRQAYHVYTGGLDKTICCGGKPDSTQQQNERHDSYMM